MFTDLMTITPLSSKTLYGREAYLDADSREVMSFIERRPRMIQTIEGRTIIASATIYMNDTEIIPSDRLTYADGSQAKIVSIFIPRDELGPHHAEVSVQ